MRQLLLFIFFYLLVFSGRSQSSSSDSLRLVVPSMSKYGYNNVSFAYEENLLFNYGWSNIFSIVNVRSGCLLKRKRISEVHEIFKIHALKNDLILINGNSSHGDEENVTILYDYKIDSVIWVLQNQCVLGINMDSTKIFTWNEDLQQAVITNPTRIRRKSQNKAKRSQRNKTNG